MNSIVIVGPNPAVDHVLAVPNFEAGRMWRTGEGMLVAGGKPLNVARGLRRLDTPVQLVAPLGGLAGALIARACEDLEIALDAVPVREPTRTCVVISDPVHGDATVINEAGPGLTPEEAAQLQETAIQAAAAHTMTVCSGSLPPGLPATLYRSVAERTHHAVIDTSGKPLRLVLDAHPWVIKVNEEELLEATGATTLAHAVDGALGRGVQNVVVTRGANGAVYAGQAGRWMVPAAPVQVVNPIGGGDAFLAGLCAALWRGASWPEALRQATACAGLVVSHLSPDVGPKPELLPLEQAIQIVPWETR